MNFREIKARRHGNRWTDGRVFSGSHVLDQKGSADGQQASPPTGTLGSGSDEFMSLCVPSRKSVWSG